MRTEPERMSPALAENPIPVGGFPLMMQPGLPPGDYPDHALAVGVMAPPLTAQGWINDDPGERREAGTALTVVDLWASW